MNSHNIPSGSSNSPSSRVVIKRIRVKKEDSAFVYSIFESYEGIASYSTVDYKPGEAHRDMELVIPREFTAEVESVLQQLGEIIYELGPS